MGVREKEPSAAVVVTADLELLDHVLAVAEAAGVELQVVSDAGLVRPLWAAASTVVLGVDQAAHVAQLVLPRRPGVFVVGQEESRDEVCSWSLPLSAAVVLLPTGANQLSTALADANGQGGGGRVLAVIGGSGGAGASTCAAALAFVAARRGLRTLLVDCDPLGGGLDLLVGAERVPGWRWPRLSNAHGHLGSLAGRLPSVDGVDVLAMARGSQSDPPPDADQVLSVLLSARRTHELIVVDVPRHLTSAGREALRRADEVLLVVVAQLRGVSGAQQVLDQLRDACATPSLLVRATRPRSLPSEVVADSLGLLVAGVVVDETSIALAAARGEPPGRSARSGIARSCGSVLDASVLAGVPA